MNDLDRVLREATAEIAEEYFRLPIFNDDPVYRERVYCYELYHQMRLRWPKPDASPFRLNAEVDKRGHVAMEQLGIRGQKPDFLVHVPGDMKSNHTIIEVKPAPSQLGDIRKDLRTLSAFLNAGYDRAIYLFYGHRADERLITRIRKAARDVENTAGIGIWFHTEVGNAAAPIATLE